ncbi:MAG: PVC-type heme-binding CxxCH protein, partial [Planctomycetota bacterium]
MTRSFVFALFLMVLCSMIPIVSPRVHADGIDDIAGGLMLPEDLEVKVWAKSPLFFNPTSIDVDERGRVWVAEAVNYRVYNNKSRMKLRREKGDRIVIVEDSDGDGLADRSKVFVQDEDLVAPLGVTVAGRHVLVACSPRLLIFDRDESDRMVGKRILLEGFGGVDHDHSLHRVELGPDGDWYFNVGNAGPHKVTDRSGWNLRSGSWYTGGSPYNKTNQAGLKSDDGRVYSAGVAFRVEPTGRGLHVIGYGFRNPYGMAVDSFG